MWVLDVGAAPGGWSQVIAERVGSNPGNETVVAVDLLAMDPVEGVHFIQGDINKDVVQEQVSKLMDYNKADLVCSDAVPDFVGTRFVDHMQAVNLNEEIVNFCSKTLKPGGNLLMKIIMGPAESRLQESILMQFESV